MRYAQQRSYESISPQTPLQSVINTHDQTEAWLKWGEPVDVTTVPDVTMKKLVALQVATAPLGSSINASSAPAFTAWINAITCTQFPSHDTATTPPQHTSCSTEEISTFK
jgi:hypothetical protein